MERSDLELVMAIRDGGTLAAAAVRLDLAPSAVTKRLAALEGKLGQRLFQRTTRRVSATAEGEMLCERAQSLLQGFAALEEEMQEQKQEPTGLIRLAATFGFGRLWLGPALAGFQQRYPRVEIQLQLTEQLPDLAQEGFDGAIWLWAIQGRQAAQWVARRLAPNQRVLVASPRYLEQHGTPTALQDLQNHGCLVARENGSTPGRRFDTWVLHNSASASAEAVRVHGPLSSNSGELVRDWCLEGRGIMLRSLWDIAPELAAGRLERVLPGYVMPDADIHWLAPYRSDSPKRIRLLVEFLLAQFEDAPWKVKPSAACEAAPQGSHPAP